MKEEEFLDKFYNVAAKAESLMGEEWRPNPCCTDADRQQHQYFLGTREAKHLFSDGAAVFCDQQGHFSSAQIILKSSDRVVTVQVMEKAGELVAEKLEIGRGRPTISCGSNPDMKKNRKPAPEHTPLTERQRRLEADVALLNRFKGIRPDVRQFAKINGFRGQFFDYLDSAAEEFKNVIRRAQRRLSTLHKVIETDEGDFGYDTDWVKLGIPATWKIVRWRTGYDPTEGSERSADGILLGVAHAFRDEANNLRCVILIRKSIQCQYELEELRYYLKLALLLHEIGHVEDITGQTNFNFGTDPVTVDGLEAEVYANCYALNECREQGYVVSFELLWSDLSRHEAGVKAEEARRIKDCCDTSLPRPWWTFDKKE